VSQQINLFNPIFLKKKKYFSTAAMVQALGLLSMGITLMAAFATYQVSMLRNEALVINDQLNTAQNQLVKLSAEYGGNKKGQPLEQQIKQVESDIQALRQVFDVLQKGDIGNTKGYSAYLQAFARQIVDGVWLTGITLIGAGNEIGLQGKAVQPELVPVYMNRLKKEPVMQGKSFGTLEMQVPQLEPAKDAGKDAPKDAAAKAKPGELAGYIEFRLH
jgi:Tfp pilus assembly protein PilN